MTKREQKTLEEIWATKKAPFWVGSTIWREGICARIDSREEENPGRQNTGFRYIGEWNNGKPLEYMNGRGVRYYEVEAPHGD